MCPGTLAIIGTAASAAGSVTGGISSAQAANYQGQVARNNATIAANNARYSASATSAATTQEGLKARAQDANIKAGAAANGVDVDTGSPANVLTSQRELGDLDVATVANRGAQQVYGYRSQAVSDTAQSKLDFSQEAPDVLGGVLNAAGDVAKGAPGLPTGGGSFSAPDMSSDMLSPESLQIPSSLISGSPSLPSSYAWMGSNGSAELDDLGL
jgi:hypothetical protein